MEEGKPLIKKKSESSSSSSNSNSNKNSKKNPSESLLPPENKNESAMDEFKRNIKLLLKCERSLFISFGLSFSMSFQYYIIVTLIPLYLSDEHGFSDLLAGVVFGAFGITIGVISVIIALYSKGVPPKKALIISSVFGFVGFIVLVFDNIYASLISIIILEAISSAMSWPYIEYCVGEFSSPEVKNVSSSIYYIANYASGIIAGVFIDTTWTALEGSDYLYIVIYGVTGSMTLLSFVLVLFLRPLSSEEYVESDSSVQSKTFWRYVAFIGMLVLLRSSCFGHIDTTIPKYLIRSLDDENAHFGTLLAIHSVTMICGIFFLTALTYKYSSYTLIYIGGLIGSISTSIMIFWEAYWGFIFAIIGISIGESLWVPRLLDYTYKICPKEHERVYLALSNCPFYFGMIITGVTSGLLLEAFCPEDGEQQCNLVWVVIFLSSLSIAISIILMRSILEEPEKKSSENLDEKNPVPEAGIDNDRAQSKYE